MGGTDAILVIVLLVLIGCVLVVRHLVRFSKRQLASVVERTTTVRAKLQPPGPGRDATLLRMRLEAELHTTRQMLANAPKGVVFRADARALLADLDTTASSLLAELTAIEQFRDSGQQRAALDAVGTQAEGLIETTYRARQTILQTSAEDRARELTRLRANVDAQADALDRYRERRELDL